VRTASAGRTAASPATPSLALGNRVLQRKCACGSSKSALGEMCDECQSEALQRKLVIGASDDPYEREADRVAAAVLSAPVGQVPPRISRLAAPPGATGALGAAPPSVERALAGSGRPLDPMLRDDMEQRFGYDFSRVRVHVGAGAELSAHDVKALAYTVGHDIAFGAGQYAPATRRGRQLLAHELTHVVQQTGTARIGALQAPSAARIHSEGRLVQRDSRVDVGTPVALPSHEIRWVYHWLSRDIADPRIWDVHIRIDFETAERRDRLSPGQIAEAVVATLEQFAGLTFTAEGRKAYLEAIEKAIAERPVHQSYVLSVTDMGLQQRWRSSFEPKSYQAHADAVLKAPGPTRGRQVFAEANFAIDEPPSKEGPKKTVEPSDKPPPAIAKQIRDVNALLEEVRKQEHRPRDLPDRLVHYSHKDGWYLNVWAHLDPQGKEKTHKAIRLKEGESAQQLFERVLMATQQALDITRTAEQRRREYEMPAWALRLKRELDQRLHQLTGGKKAEDVPDGMKLGLSTEGVQTAGPGASPATEPGEEAASEPPQVVLQVWVQRRKSTERNYGSFPITPEATVDMLVPYVRRLAAILRQFEATPRDVAFTPRMDVEQPLAPFAAKILPRDLQSDNITVEDANNKFTMDLDFEERYQSGPDNDIFIASKLYNQAIFFHWTIYPVPPELRPDPEKKIPDDWLRGRWHWLYKRYNGEKSIDAGGTIYRTIADGSVQRPSTTPVYNSRDDISTRVSFNGDPGEYLVYCETHHAPIGDAGLNRASSVAYYPVLTKSKEDITHPLVSQTAAATREATERLEEIKEQERPENLAKLDDYQKLVLAEARRATEKQLQVLDVKERSDLVATTAAEIKDGTERLDQVKRLVSILPGILEKAKENEKSGVEPKAPSKLLVLTAADLVPLYWQLLQENKSATRYQKELEQQLEDLRKVHARAVEFQDEFKGESGACLYTPEAVFLSELDGHVYPLVLMVGESRKRGMGAVSYTVSDVTTPETQKRYHGISFKSGPAGHIEAIDRAFGDFGDEATYGEGWIAVRMPSGREECRPRRRSEITLYRSKEGILEKVWKALGFIAMVVGMAALVASGFGAPVVAGLLGAVAGVLGAAQAIRNISEREARHKLEVDAELALDIIGILGLGQIAASARLATLPRTIRGFQTAQRIGRYLAAYNLATEGATAILIPVQLVEDIDKIKALGLDPRKEAELIRQAVSGAIETGVMFLGASAGSRVISRARGGALPVEDDFVAIQQKAELMAMEETGQYKSLQDRGWVDPQNNWTTDAPDVVLQKLAETGVAPTKKTPTGGESRAEVAAPPKAAMEGVERVDQGRVKVEGEPGRRRADLGDGHEIVEVQGGIACEYRSPGGPRVPCPTGMGLGGPDAPARPAETQRTPAAGAEGLPRELLPQDLVSARRQERVLQEQQKGLIDEVNEKKRTISEYEQEKIPQKQAAIDDYRRRKPAAGPDDKILAKHNAELEVLERSLATLKDLKKSQQDTLKSNKRQLDEIRALKKHYEGSKPWRNVPLDGSEPKRAGLAGELEMSTGIQGAGYEPAGKTVRAEGIVISEDFNKAFANWHGQSGIDGIYKRQNPETGEMEYIVAESKTTGDPKRGEPSGTKGALDTMTTGERQLSDQWINDRLDSSGLSAVEVKEIKAAMAAGKLRKVYALTDQRGTRFFDVTNVSSTDVTIGAETKF
jgi:hypothetical protein